MSCMICGSDIRIYKEDLLELKNQELLVTRRQVCGLLKK